MSHCESTRAVAGALGRRADRVCNFLLKRLRRTIEADRGRFESMGRSTGAANRDSLRAEAQLQLSDPVEHALAGRSWASARRKPEAKTGSENRLGRRDMAEGDGATSHFNRALSLFDQGELEQALEHFRAGHEADPSNAKLRSHYGLCLGLVERDFQRSAELCRSAAKQEFFNPALYLNLARLHLSFGFKSEGRRYLERGMMIDPGNVPIAKELAELGRRDPPIFQFLPRRHVLNRWLGRARHQLAHWNTGRTIA